MGQYVLTLIFNLKIQSTKRKSNIPNYLQITSFIHCFETPRLNLIYGIGHTYVISVLEGGSKVILGYNKLGFVRLSR